MLKQHDKNLVNEPEKVKSSSVNIPPINDAVKAIEKEISQAAVTAKESVQWYISLSQNTPPVPMPSFIPMPLLFTTQDFMAEAYDTKGGAVCICHDPSCRIGPFIKKL